MTVQTAMTQLEQVVRLDLEGLGIPSLAKLQKTNWAPAMRSISSYEVIFGSDCSILLV